MTENQPVLISESGDIPGFQIGSQKFCFLNLRLDVEIGGVTYHLQSEFSEKAEMGDMIDTTELERGSRKSA